jgi:serine/threonine protein kinase
MSPERWQQVARLYQSALEQVPASRAAFIADACRDDSDLRDEVESLLARDEASVLVDRPVHAAAAAVLTSASGLTPDSLIGPYRVTALIGEGGMGQVYRARDTKLNRDVALKILPDAFVHDGDRVARFAREAQVLAALNHPNIGAIHGFEDSGPVHALVLELVEGPTLADRIARGPVPLDEALPIARQIAEALEAAHEHGVVHRDLKPANIKVRDDGTVKVLDFGLAKLTDANVPNDPNVRTIRTSPLTHSPTVMSPAMTAMGVILGTAAYMSPEQAKGKPADRRSDIWAFGCVLYEMLTATRAFEGEDVSDTLAAVLRGAPDWTRLPASTPSSIRRVLRRCLQKDANRRLPSIAAAFLDIEEAFSADEAPASVPMRAQRRSRRLLIPALAIVVAAVGGILVTLGYVRATSPQPRAVRFTFPQPPNTTFTGNYGIGPTSTPEIAISPDGRNIVFVAVEGGVSKLWLRAVDAVDTVALPGTERAASPFWSPDGGSVAFFAEGKLKKVLVGGGRAVVVCDAEFGAGGTWNRDDVIVFAPYRFREHGESLKRVSAAGGTVTDATRDVAGERHGWPQFLPDGRHFLYIAWFGSNEPARSTTEPELRIGSLDSNESAVLFRTQSSVTYAAGHLFFWRDGSVLAEPFDAASRRITGIPFPVADQVGHHPVRLNMAFAASDSGVMAYAANAGLARSRLIWMDRTGRTIGALGEPGFYGSFELAPDETRVAVTLDSGTPLNRDVWIMDSNSGVASRFTFDLANDTSPVWSPDGRQIIFTSTRGQGGTNDMYVKSVTGVSGERLLLTQQASQVPLDWSPDGRFVVYRQVTVDTDLWMLPLTSKNGQPASGSPDGLETGKPFPFVEDPFPETDAAFSPDSHFVAFDASESNPGTRAPSMEQRQVYVGPFPSTGTKFQISGAGGGNPRWRGDGRELFFLAPDGSMMAAAIDTTAAFRAAVPQRLFGVGADFFDVSKDGRRFLVRVPQGFEPTPLTVVVNWQATAKR